MTDTIKLDLPLWDPGITQPDLVYNSAMDKLDLFVGLGVKSRTVTAQPGAPVAGDAYILAATHTGAAWAGFAQHDIAVFRNSIWTAIAPVGRIVAEVDDEAVQVAWTGATWSVRTTTTKVNYTAVVNPEVTDDSAAGYGVGSTWVNTVLDKWYVCTDASVGAAVWATGGGLTAKYKDANYTLLPGDTVFVNTELGAFTQSLPATPVDGDYVAIVDGEANAAINNITIDRNGNTIDGAATNIIIDVNNGRVDLVYSLTNTTWEYQFTLVAGQLLAADVEDTILTASNTGLPAYGLRTFIQAAGFYDGTTPADFGAFTRVESGATGAMIGYRTASGTVEQEGQVALFFADRFNFATHGMKFQVQWYPTVTNAGDVKFELSAIGYVDGDEINRAFIIGGTVVDSSQLSITKLQITPLSAAFTFTAAQLPPTSISHWRLRRLALDAEDTLAFDIRIVCVIIHTSPRANNDLNGNDF